MLAENLSSLGLLLLFEKEFVDVARDASLGNRNLTNKLVQLLIVLNGKLDVSGNNTGLLVLAGAVAGKLKQLSNEVFEDGAHENSRCDLVKIEKIVDFGANLMFLAPFFQKSGCENLCSKFKIGL